ncbi:MAG: YciI family protein, partial [Pseudomonadota bacterium]
PGVLAIRFVKREDVMPKWSEYKAQAEARGSLAFEVFVAISTPVADAMSRFADVLPRHLDHVRSLEAKGALMFAGPLSDETGEEMQAMGMLVLRAASLEEARALVEADPMHSEGVRSFSLRRWLINEGSVNLTLGLSTKAITL